MNDKSRDRIEDIGSVLRFITPALIGVSIFMMGQIWIQINSINDKAYLHQTNHEIHTPRSEFARVELAMQNLRETLLEQHNKG